jgi:hypothetical protein
MRVSVAVAIGILLPGLALAQSLGEVAKKEKERRKQGQAAGKVLTEEDLKKGKGQLANDPTGTTPAPAATAAPASSAASDAAYAAATAKRQKEESEWRARAAEAQAKVAEAKKRYETVSKMSLVIGERYVDQNGKTVVGSAEELQRMTAQAKADWDAAQRELDDLMETARRQGVPPGWLR